MIYRYIWIDLYEPNRCARLGVRRMVYPLLELAPVLVWTMTCKLDKHECTPKLTEHRPNIKYLAFRCLYLAALATDRQDVNKREKVFFVRFQTNELS